MTSSPVSSHGGAKIREMDGKGGRCVWEVLNCDSTGRGAAAEVVYMSRCDSTRSACAGACTHGRQKHADINGQRRGRGRPINIY